MRATEVTLSINNLPKFAAYREVLTAWRKYHPVSFIEVLWDNFCHVEPSRLRSILEGLAPRVSLHIMHSRFLHLSEERFGLFLNHLAKHVQVLQPLYVSDHIGNFVHKGIALLTPAEHDYGRASSIRQRVIRYQETIKRPLLLENYASTEQRGKGQVDFFAWLVAETSCELLFDVSNAVVAEANHILPVSAWLPLLQHQSVRCHAGGYAKSPTTGLFHDTHNAPVSNATLQAWRKLQDRVRVQSLVLERDYNFNIGSVMQDLHRLVSRGEG
jgi:uncharacterized protein (UPF0276 family)